MTKTRGETIRCEVLVVGSGFAGTILARVLARQGRDVVLVERGRHPRFALGESSTPLAAFSLERLAAAWSLPDLHQLAAYGRWREHLSPLRHGLKRGFSFYHHSVGEDFVNSEANEHRLLVAASPGTAVADSHWLRADVDHHLVQRAVAEGVRFRDQIQLNAVVEGGRGLVVSGGGISGPCRFETSFLVDASGGGGFLASHLPIPSAVESQPRPATSLLYGHFRGVEDFVALEGSRGSRFTPGPYPDHRAAVHHLFEDGWLYLLPFDHGVVSAGLLRRSAEEVQDSDPTELWKSALASLPSLQRLFAGAREVERLRFVPQIRYRLESSVGRRWLVLPHGYAFVDPLFSTGMAWSLLAVERVAALFAESADLPTEGGLARYSDLLSLEADQIEDLVEGGWACFGNFRAFAASSYLYFAAASFQELRQRLADQDSANPWIWEGFLGASDPVCRSFAEGGRARAQSLASSVDVEDRRQRTEAFEAWVRQAIVPRNVIGLAAPGSRNLYPVDLEEVLRNCSRLGLSRSVAEDRLDRLRSSF